MTGGAPIGIAHGVKIDPTNAADTVSALRNGQMLGPGSSSLCCGSGIETVSYECLANVVAQPHYNGLIRWIFPTKDPGH